MTFAEFDTFKDGSPHECPACGDHSFDIIISEVNFIENFVSPSGFDPTKIIFEDGTRGTGPTKTNRAERKADQEKFARRNARLDDLRRKGQMNVPAMERFMNKYKVRKY